MCKAEAFHGLVHPLSQPRRAPESASPYLLPLFWKCLAGSRVKYFRTARPRCSMPNIRRSWRHRAHSRRVLHDPLHDTVPTSLRAAKGRWSRWTSSREIKAKTTERGYGPPAAISGRLSPGPRRRLSHRTGSLPASISRPPAAPSPVVVVADSGQRSPAFNKQARSIPRHGHRRSQLPRRRSP